MNLFRKPTPQNLCNWLNSASWGLVSSAQARIRTEIEAHYAESVQAHVGRGLTESAAQAAALAELGDAYAAGKRFRREYLTVEDAQWLARWLDPVRGAGGPIFLLGFWYTIFFPPDPQILFLRYPGNWSSMADPHFVFRAAIGLLQILITGSTIFAAGVIARRKGALDNMRKMALLACILMLNVCLLLLGQYLFVPMFVVIFLFWPLTSLIRVLRLYRKLRLARGDDLHCLTVA